MLATCIQGLKNISGSGTKDMKSHMLIAANAMANVNTVTTYYESS